jgi:energy-coupling factor transport system substrate-specific component
MGKETKKNNKENNSQKMKLSIKDITFIAVLASVTVVIGFIFYFMSRFMPIPGNKFIIFAPFLGFIMYFPVKNKQKIGVITIFSLVFSFLMLFINFYMGLSIFLSGILTDLYSLIFFQNYRQDWKMIASAGFYPTASFFWAFIMSYLFTGNMLFNLIAKWEIIFSLIFIIYLLGIIGALIAKNIIYPKVFFTNQ